MRINVKNLKQVLSVNARSLRSRVIIPDYENILFDVSGETCYLTTRFDAMQVKTYLKIENDKDYCFQVEGSTFIKTIDLIDTEHVDIKVNDKTIVVQSGKSKYKIPISPGTHYPKMRPNNMKEIAMTPAICRHISNASPFINEHDQRLGITGVHILTEKGMLKIMGTDSQCFYHAQIKADAELEPVTLHKSVTGIIDVFKDATEITYGSSAEMAMLKDGGTEVMVRVLDFPFPSKSLTTLIEKKDEGSSVVFNTSDTSKSIKRALVYSSMKSHEVVLEFKDGEVTAEAEDNATSKSAKEYIDASDIQINELRIAVNGQILQRAMSGIDSENVKVKIIDYNQPIFVTDEHEEGESLTIFMPILLKQQ